MNKICYAEKMLVASMIVLAIALFASLANAQSISPFGIDKLPPNEIAISGDITSGDVNKDNFALSILGTMQQGGWVFVGDVNSIKGTVKDTLTARKETFTIEASKFFDDRGYGFLWINALEMPLSGLSRNTESIGGIGFQLAPKMFFEAGIGHRRLWALDAATARVLEKEPVMYAGANVEHTTGTGVVYKGKADYTFGEKRSIGRSELSATMPLVGSPILFRVSAGNVIIDPPPAGSKSSNSTVLTSLVARF